MEWLLAHPEGPQLFAAWWHMRRADLGLERVLSGQEYYGVSLDAAIDQVIRQALAEHGGNRRLTAQALGIDRVTLYRWLQPRSAATPANRWLRISNRLRQKAGLRDEPN